MIPIKVFTKIQGVLISFFGRANMTFVDKYLLTITARREASSRFNGSEQTWGNFSFCSFCMANEERRLAKR